MGRHIRSSACCQQQGARLLLGLSAAMAGSFQRVTVHRYMFARMAAFSLRLPLLAPARGALAISAAPQLPATRAKALLHGYCTVTARVTHRTAACRRAMLIAMRTHTSYGSLGHPRPPTASGSQDAALPAHAGCADARQTTWRSPPTLQRVRVFLRGQTDAPGREVTMATPLTAKGICRNGLLPAPQSSGPRHRLNTSHAAQRKRAAGTTCSMGPKHMAARHSTSRASRPTSSGQRRQAREVRAARLCTAPNWAGVSGPSDTA